MMRFGDRPAAHRYVDRVQVAVNPPDTKSANERLTLGLAIVFPTIVTLAYFVWLKSFPSWIQQVAYLSGKTLQFALPVVWVLIVLKRRPAWKWPTAQSVGLGLAFGLLVLGAMQALYFGWFRHSAMFANVVTQVVEKLDQLDLQSPLRFVVLGVFYTLGHSLLEEYYWRWFVFNRLRDYVSVPAANALSSLGFMAHHVVLLGVYFGWDSPLTYLFSLAVAVGGSVWAWMYHRTGELWGAWISHAMVDASIFMIGYHIAGL